MAVSSCQDNVWPEWYEPSTAVDLIAPCLYLDKESSAWSAEIQLSAVTKNPTRIVQLGEIVRESLISARTTRSNFRNASSSRRYDKLGRTHYFAYEYERPLRHEMRSFPLSTNGRESSARFISAESAGKKRRRKQRDGTAVR